MLTVIQLAYEPIVAARILLEYHRPLAREDIDSLFPGLKVLKAQADETLSTLWEVSAEASSKDGAEWLSNFPRVLRGGIFCLR